VSDKGPRPTQPAGFSPGYCTTSISRRGACKRSTSEGAHDLRLAGAQWRLVAGLTGLGYPAALLATGGGHLNVVSRSCSLSRSGSRTATGID
jgi:hypothetical protein